jgi:hypothetical protein
MQDPGSGGGDVHDSPADLGVTEHLSLVDIIAGEGEPIGYGFVSVQRVSVEECACGRTAGNIGGGQEYLGKHSGQLLSGVARRQVAISCPRRRASLAPRGLGPIERPNGQTWR